MKCDDAPRLCITRRLWQSASRGPFHPPPARVIPTRPVIALSATISQPVCPTICYVKSESALRNPLNRNSSSAVWGMYPELLTYAPISQPGGQGGPILLAWMSPQPQVGCPPHFAATSSRRPCSHTFRYGVMVAQEARASTVHVAIFLASISRWNHRSCEVLRETKMVQVCT